jgi:penicillin-binding protein 2
MFLESPPPRREPEPDPLPLALRAATLGVVAAVLLGVLLFRLWALQVLHSGQAAQAAVANQIRTTPIFPQRGTIVDRGGHTLVGNTPSLVLQINPATLPQPANCKGYRRHHAADRRAEPGCNVLARMADVLQVPFRGLYHQYRRGLLVNPGYPVTVDAPVTLNEIEYVKERMPRYRGMQFVQTFQRNYPMGSVAANVLGNVTQVQATDLKNPHFRGEHLDPNGTVGRSGVEWTYDAYLRGVDGQVAQSFDAAGHPVGSPYLTSVPQAGDTLQLNIDSHLQQVAQSAIRYGISVAHSDGQGFSTQGAIVAMNPDTGAVYALASWPSYDPSIWVAPYKGQNQVLRAAKAANKAPISHPSPLIDRTSGEYPAGSTFKPFTAGAAWMAGLIGPGSERTCPGVYYSPYDHGKPRTAFHNWTPLSIGSMALPEALTISCDSFFYQLGDEFYGKYVANPTNPVQALLFQKGLGKFGYGKPPTDFDLLTAAGLVPTPAWKKAEPCFQPGFHKGCSPQYVSANQALIDQSWEPGDDINMSIGQGYLLVTPLQEAVAYSALANGGKVMAPHVARAIVDPATGQTVKRIGPRVVRNLGLPSTFLDEVSQGLFGATHASDGTSSAVFGNFTPTVYGKTGTAEVPQDCVNCSDAWWSGWAGQGNKKLVVVAMIQDGGHGGVSAAPAALRVFEAYFHKKLTAVTGTDVSH